MLAIRKQTDPSKTHTRYSIVIFKLFEIAFGYHILRGDHLDLSIGIGPLDINFGTTIWQRFWRE